MNKVSAGILVGYTFNSECSSESTHGDSAKQAEAL